MTALAVLAAKLAAIFFKVGLFTLGGGLAIIALVRQEVLSRGWLSPGEFSDILGIAQSTPGPIGVNAATFTGYRVFANAGSGMWFALAASLLSTVAVTLPSVVGAGVGGAWFERHRNGVFTVSVFGVLRPCVSGFVCAVGADLAVECWRVASAEPALLLKICDGVFFSLAVWAGFSSRISPVWVLFASAFAGVLSR